MAPVADDKKKIKVISKNDATKNNLKSEIYNFGVELDFKPCEFYTSNKMRSWNTAKLEKVMKKVAATIDHILVIRNKTLDDTMASIAYIVDDSGKLVQVTDKDTLTTSLKLIADHALLLRGPFATYNIKSAKIEKSWAEFTNSTSAAFLQNDVILNEAKSIFKKHMSIEFDNLPENGKGYINNHRCDVFDYHLSPYFSPHIKVEDNEGKKKVEVFFGGLGYVLDLSGEEYKKPKNTDSLAREQEGWLESLLRCLNAKTDPKGNDKFGFFARDEFLDKGYKYINFLTEFMNSNTIGTNGKSIKQMYTYWYNNIQDHQVAITAVVKEIKKLHKDLKVMFFQEFPKGRTAQKFADNLKEIGEIYHKDDNCAILIFK